MTSEIGLISEPLAPVIPVENAAEVHVVTTPEETEGFHIIRAILRGVISPQRIFMRDAQSYCAILLDDNNRKPICRLRFNNTQKLSLGLFNEKREEERVALESVDEIYNYSERLKATVLSQQAPDGGQKADPE